MAHHSSKPPTPSKFFTPADFIPTPADFIEARASRVQELAATITERIESFQEWLAQLPGRLVAETWIENPDGNPDEGNSQFGIQLGRDGKAWVLFYSIVDVDHDPHSDYPDWKALTTASLTQKKWALSMFPALLDAILGLQESRVAELEKAVNEFDAFAEKVGMTRKDGE